MMGTSTCYCNFKIDFEFKKPTQKTLTALEGKSTDALCTGVYQANEAASKDLNYWRNKTKTNQKYPKPNQNKKEKA